MEPLSLTSSPSHERTDYAKSKEADERGGGGDVRLIRHPREAVNKWCRLTVATDERSHPGICVDRKQ